MSYRMWTLVCRIGVGVLSAAVLGIAAVTELMY